MTQDRIRKAFEAWLGAPNDSWKDDPLSVGSIQEEAWQACAAEMGKDMDAIAGKMQEINEITNGGSGRVPVLVKEALALADKWRG